VSAQKIHTILASLASRRPVFHSEADFQHALAWELQLADRKAHIRLEKQVASEGSRVHLDLLVRSSADELAIEVKYKTRAARFIHEEEEYSLRNQSAQDIGRHDFIKDVQRLEKYVNTHKRSEGYAILLTNDPTYWTESRRGDCVDAQFRIHEGRVLQGGATWSAKASAGTKHKREEPLALNGKYHLQWFNYSSFGAGSAERFRYVVLRVPSDA
jgi:hypothetical protein